MAKMRNGIVIGISHENTKHDRGFCYDGIQTR